MKNSDLYPSLESETDPRFGPIPGISTGDHFMKRFILLNQIPQLLTQPRREDCSRVGLHSKNFAGISGTVALGAFSIVLSNGYEDDKDEGESL